MHPATTYLILRTLNVLGMSLTWTSYSPYLLQGLHVTPSEIGLLNALFFFTIFLCELPTGMLADARGRGWAVRMAFVFHLIGMLAYGFAIGFWSALLAEFLERIAFAFMSGACSAWIKDALVRRNEDSRHRSILGTEVIVVAAITLIGTQGGHLSSLYSFRYPWLIGSIVQCTGLIVAIKYMNGDGEPTERITEREAFRRSWRQLRALPGLRWAAIAGMTLGFALTFNHFWSPYFRTYVDEAYIGLVWIPLYGALALSGWVMKRSAVSEGRIEALIAVTLFLIGVSLIGVTLAMPLTGVIGMAMIHEMARGIFKPQLDLFLQRQFESSYRATAGSVNSFIRSCGFGVILLGVWFFTRQMEPTHASISSLWTWSGGLMAASALLLFLFRPARSPVSLS